MNLIGITQEEFEKCLKCNGQLMLRDREIDMENAVKEASLVDKKKE